MVTDHGSAHLGFCFFLRTIFQPELEIGQTHQNLKFISDYNVLVNKNYSEL